MATKKQVVIGIDPDAEKHGVAIYLEGKLEGLYTMNLVDLVRSGWLDRQDEVLFGIEDTLANEFVYSRNVQRSKAAQSKIAMLTGRCQQAQAELMRFLEAYQVPYRLFKPQRGNWAKDRAYFERVTGWKGQSNQDTRSAAFFGFLALK